MMSRTFATIFVLVSSYVTMCTAYEDDKEPIWDFDDILSQRSQAEKQQDRDESSEILKFAMPGVHPTKEDTYLCTAVDLHRKEEYIVAIKPLVDMHTAHHLMIFGCPEPANYAFANDGKYWTCGESGPNKCSHGSTAKILYAWGRNAPELDLPPADPTLKDYAGAELHMMSVRPSQLAAVFLLQPFGDIPPKKKDPVNWLLYFSYNHLETFHQRRKLGILTLDVNIMMDQSYILLTLESTLMELI
ncbi:Peptidyl-glycine alpha-amidating monooxygenase [Stylophora pistillata]|uniref:Peptidyl-glycine alpha-amidating monooxygenase n=1 Tax=Stylophora pistillata TaxID=50429 RepID=A0A2B4T2M1_STYPI|nr:Peptidyl-glycine alpha-amidating monooxygenase [Stylophora pistillata]